MKENRDLQSLIAKAVEGDKKALNALIDGIHGFIYNISIKILWHPEEASDATQEILIKVITHLSQFKQESAFNTWVYRIAINYLFTLLNRQKRQQISFDIFSKDIANGLLHEDETDSHENKEALAQEVKIGCSLAMLQCLDGDSRITYVLGEILELDSMDGSYIQEISPETFRKRLSRARLKINEFTRVNCGRVHKPNPCRCHKRIAYAITNGRVNPNRLLFASSALISEIENIETTAQLIRTNPDFSFPNQRLDEIKKIFIESRI